MSSLEQSQALLQRAEWLKRPEAQRLFALLDGGQERTLAVGGIVRDTLLDMARSDTDLDLATELTPDAVMARAQKAGVAAYPTGISHGTVTLKLDTLVAEVTTLREDVATDGRHAVVQFGTDWRRDAERRDFTLNALYATMDGRLFDPLGGLADCLAGQVRFIGDPATRIREDRLRVFRFFRFSASHGGERFDAEGLAACAAAAGALDRLAAERVGGEMRRMLDLPRIGNTLRQMREAGIVDLGEPALDLIHRHERRVTRPRFVERLALLFFAHDPEALRAQWRLSRDDMRVGGAVLEVSRMLMDFRLHEAAFRHPGMLSSGLDVAATLADWSEAGRGAVREQLEQIEVPRFPLSGDDLLAAGLSGPAVGSALGRLEKLWIESGFALDRETLLERL
ncbi:CCA tRNA nucleotidyltransferase [Devosia sp.]|uniref:CCA tRNA nucleotidyltransferase n=1 Tax=Devosia sp. TaxID=1871048 RepID=UPI003A8E2C0D